MKRREGTRRKLNGKERGRLWAHLLESSLNVMSPRIEGDDLLGVEPRRLRRKVKRRVGIGVVGFVVGIEGVESDGESFVDGVGPGVGTAKENESKKRKEGEKRQKREEREEKEVWLKGTTHPIAFLTLSDEGCLEATTGPREAASAAPHLRGTGLIPT